MDDLYSDILQEAAPLLARQALGEPPLTDAEAAYLDQLLEQLREPEEPPEAPAEEVEDPEVLRLLEQLYAHLDALQAQGIPRRESLRSSISDLLLGLSMGLLSFSGLALLLFLLYHGFMALSALTGLPVLPLGFLTLSIVLGLLLLSANKRLTELVLSFVLDERQGMNEED